MGIHGHGTGQKHQGAFTVLEMMVTLTIAAILLAAGVPSFQQFLAQQRMRAAINSLHIDLLSARSQAVYRNAVVVACPGNPQSGCSGASNWSAGWIIFEDENRDRHHQDGEPLLRHGQEHAHIEIHGPAQRTEVRFFPDGSAPGSNASMSLCGTDGPPGARKLVISNIGRIRRETFEELDPAFCPT
jgi:type IV fimbrial biogenesis protein FimT